jgi:hypothetical protein
MQHQAAAAWVQTAFKQLHRAMAVLVISAELSHLQGTANCCQPAISPQVDKGTL